jgi:diadenosine tetraphosphate (Ap4A) HIT family hydrolase
MTFALHPQLQRDTFVLGDYPLCRLLMMNDAQYPWFILVPRRAGLRELHELDEAGQRQFWQESGDLSRALLRVFAGDKLNLAALGNVVPQLHVHHIVRRHGDPAWPAPVWGRHPPQAYSPAAAAARSAQLLPQLGAGFGPATG